MKLTVETDTVTHEFHGDTIAVKPAASHLRVFVDGTHLATFKNWVTWRITNGKDENK